MTQICATSPVPSLGSITVSLGLRTPGSLFTVCGAPFGTYRNRALEGLQLRQDLQNVQLLKTVMSAIQPIAQFLGVGLSSVVPQVPGLGVDAFELLNGSACSLSRALPSVGLGSYGNIGMQALYTVQELVYSYVGRMVQVLYDLIQEVTKKLKIPALSIAGLPVVPSISGLREAFAALLRNGIDPSSIPGFNLVAGLLDEVLAVYRNPEVIAAEYAKMLYTALFLGPLQLIVDFCLGALKVLGISFPLLCLDIGQ